VLEVTGLAKSYPTPRGVLDILASVDLALRPGDAASIVGPSGSGKSTLLYILGALEPPTEGSVTLDGVDPFTLAPAELAAYRNRRVGFVFQDHLLLPQCTVLENVLVPTLVGDAVESAQDRARDLLARAGLADRLDHRPAELSGGERQRVALARALIRRPPLLLCDEPTGNLDRAAGEVVADMLFDLHGGQETVLVVVTHNVELAARCPVRYRLEGLGLKRVASEEGRVAGDEKPAVGGEKGTDPDKESGAGA
jgi:lipoprotein-releasing system ATP-binding protein